jgi:MFS family permease
VSPPAARDDSIAALRLRHGERHRWLLLLSVMVGTMASIMSSTIINVAIPDMSQHFSLGQERAQWVSSGFMAAMTVSMLTTSWLLSCCGYRRLLAGSVAGGLAGWRAGARSSTWWCRSAWSRCGWRGGRAHQRAGGAAADPRGATLDWPGRLLATLCLLNGLVALHGGSSRAAVFLGSAALALVGFVMLQRRMLQRHGRRPDGAVAPLMNLSMFDDHRFAMGSIVAFIYGIALLGSTYRCRSTCRWGWVCRRPMWAVSCCRPAGRPGAGRHHCHRRPLSRPPTHAPASPPPWTGQSGCGQTGLCEHRAMSRPRCHVHR